MLAIVRAGRARTAFEEPLAIPSAPAPADLDGFRFVFKFTFIRFSAAEDR